MRPSHRPLRASYWLAGLLGVTFLLRWVYVLDIERSVDTSVWMASTLAVRSYPDKLWTWLNYSDSRPLTVLPLMISNALGFTISYSFTEYLGLVFVLGALTFLYHTFRQFLEPTESLMLIATACLFWSTTWFKDYVAFNSELVSVAGISVAVWGYFRYRASPEKNTGLLVLNGLVLGWLPYVKFQNVPLELVLGAFLSFELLRRRRFGQMALLVGCGILPTILIVGYFGARNQIDVFWKDYFWQYFYYSYTNDFSSLPVSQRFTPWRIARFVYAGSWQSGIYFTGLTGVLAAAGYYGYKTPKKPPTGWLPLLFGLLFWLSCLYAALQAGNFFQHYLIFYLFG
ncbi:MAG: hypothetical protein H7Y12_07530, partial [Sphingobacteriaceae bacterium]|nr:hypothetical protein [Cytophagaceae bacterium]